MGVPKCVVRNGLECSGHGVCNLGQCRCEVQWYGVACDSVVKTSAAHVQDAKLSANAASIKKADDLRAFSFRESRVEPGKANARRDSPGWTAQPHHRRPKNKN